VPRRKPLASRRDDLKWGNEARKGKGNPNWNGGKYVDDKGYIRVRMPEHPYEVHGYVYEHRLVMEKFLGRHLESWESVHHINEVKDDNRVSNFFLCTAGEHSALHREGAVQPMEYKDHMRKKMREKHKKVIKRDLKSRRSNVAKRNEI